MNFLYWNVRVIDNSDTRIAFENLFMSHKPILILIAEPMVNLAQIPPWVWSSIGVSKYCINARASLMPNLWAL